MRSEWIVVEYSAASVTVNEITTLFVTHPYHTYIGRSLKHSAKISIMADKQTKVELHQSEQAKTNELNENEVEENGTTKSNESDVMENDVTQSNESEMKENDATRSNENETKENDAAQSHNNQSQQIKIIKCCVSH